MRRVDAERREIDRRRLHPAARCDRPRNAGLRKPEQQFVRARERSDAAGQSEIGGGVQSSQAFDAFGTDLKSGFAKKLIGEEAAAHAGLAMDAPDRQIDPFRVQRFLPREHVLIDAVDQRAVEIEQEYRLYPHSAISR